MKNGVKLVPFKRCLSYQNFICFYRSREVEQPKNFSSELESPDEWESQRDNLMKMRNTLDKDILSETADSDDEDI
jgi:hypothetical protein